VANYHLPTHVGSCCFIRRSSERAKLVSILAASSPTCCGIIADFHLRSQALAPSLSSVSCCFLESSVRPLQGLSCGIMPTFICAHRRLRLRCRLTTSLSFIAALMPTCCGIIADFHLRSQALATSLLSVSCCFLESGVRPLQGLSCGIMPTFICAHRRLRHHCCLTISLSFIAALMLTCG
jgi:hypothetical protein